MKQSLVLLLVVLVLAVLLLMWVGGLAEPEPDPGPSVRPTVTAHRPPPVEEERLAPPEEPPPAPEPAAVVEEEPVDPVVEAAPEPEILSGRVVDERNGEGVPGIEVTIGKGPDVEVLRTDPMGGFRTERSYPAGKHPYRLRDEVFGNSLDSGHLLVTERGPLEAHVGPHLLVVRVGPTFRFQPSPEEVAAHGVRARVVEVWEGMWSSGTLEVDGESIELAGSDLVDSKELAAFLLENRELLKEAEVDAGAFLSSIRTDVLPDSEWHWIDGVQDEPNWIRYDRERSPLFPESRSMLEVESADGRHAGRVPLDSTRGVHPGTLAVVLREPATLSGRVIDERGRPVKEATLALASGDSSPQVLPWTRSDSEGRFELAVKRADAYVLRASEGEFSTVEKNVTLDPGWNGVGDVVLESTPRLVDVEGLLRCAHGGGSFLVRLESTSDRFDVHRSVSTVLHPALETETAAGELPGYRFRFADVPEGEYRLVSVPVADSQVGRACAPVSRSVTASGGLPLLDCASTYGQDSVVFAPYRAGTDRKLGVWYAGFGPDGTFISPIEKDAGRLPWTVPFEGPLSWVVWNPGYQPVAGDRDDFRGAPGRRTVRVDLERGWGARLFFRELQLSKAKVKAKPKRNRRKLDLESLFDSRPLSGVRVLAGGTEVAKSSGEGVAVVGLPEEPDQLQIRMPGYFALSVEQPHRTLKGISLQTVVWMIKL